MVSLHSESRLLVEGVSRWLYFATDSLTQREYRVCLSMYKLQLGKFFLQKLLGVLITLELLHRPN